MSDVDVHHLAAAYALDALDDHERREFEAHYESCEVCRADVVDFRHTMSQVAGALLAPPPPAVKDRVMAAVATTRQVSPTLRASNVVDFSAAAARRQRPVWLAVAAAAVLVLFVGGIVALTGRDGSSYEGELARVLEQSDAQVLYLGAAEGAAGTFKVAWSDSLGEAVLIGEDLPATPQGTAYELWWFPDPSSATAPPSPNEDGRLAMYVLDPAEDGNVHRSIELPESPAAWAITVEPAEGAAVTTGDVLFIAEV